MPVGPATAVSQAQGQLDQRQLLSMLTGGPGGSQPRPAVGGTAVGAPSGATTSAPPAISAANLSAILAGLGRGGGGQV